MNMTNAIGILRLSMPSDNVPVTDSSGNVTDAYNYDAYGNLDSQTGSSDNTYLYQGEQSDNLLSLQYLRARYYDPNIGRFIGTDPVEGSLTSPVSQHRYLYGNDNPIVYSDPSGEFSISETLGGIAAQDVLYGIAAGGIVTVGVALGGLFTGIRNRIESGGYIWHGSISASSIPFSPLNGFKYAELESNNIKGRWIIISSSVIPFYPKFSFGSSFGADIKEVEVFTKPKAPSALPDVRDLVGPYLAISFGILDWKLPNSKAIPFIMGWGIGVEVGTIASFKFQAKISIDQGWSWNIGQTTLMDGSDNPQIPSGED
jgi:RHS repeat-associated protein